MSLFETAKEKEVRKRLEAAGFDRLRDPFLGFGKGVVEQDDETFMVLVPGDPLEGQNPGEAFLESTCPLVGLAYVAQAGFSYDLVATYIVREA